MEKLTRHSIQWFYNLLSKGECEMVDFKEQLEDKTAFGKTLKNFAPKYDELAKDVVAFANKKGGFLFVGIEAILRYLDAVDEIDNEGARKLLLLSDSDIYFVSRLFAEMKANGLIAEIRKDNRKVWYGRIK